MTGDHAVNPIGLEWSISVPFQVLQLFSLFIPKLKYNELVSNDDCNPHCTHLEVHFKYVEIEYMYTNV